MTTRGRKRAGSRNTPTASHTASEWAITQEVRLTCPAGHVLGTARRDLAGTDLGPALRDSDSAERAPVLQWAGPPDDPTRTLRWSCPRCDRSARSRGAIARSGRTRQSETVVSSSPLLELLDSIATHGPRLVRARIDALQAKTDQVQSGEQLRAALAFKPTDDSGSTP